ncbi:UDP-N-acetylmuramate--L-alanine ligase [Patescibacteria group bacterium]|nr:UDP-N-acetylmuramate--L-alanine ligase [Patescibacteria group bacterium]MBU4453259.1 UDP-N-acetylmuramate--L-alanine ligase [Patescibacteria group bacterium]
MIQAKCVHIIGLGGIGTSAVARYFLSLGAKVSGSDVHTGSIVEDLQKEGVEFRLGHFVENVPRDCDLMIYSRAVPATNVERQTASELGIAELSYPEFLGKLAKTKKTIAVSGTNGKSTTTAMIASIMIRAGLDPTVIVGTQVPGWSEHNLRVGKGEWLVAEACEHMASFLHIQPDIAVVTNIAEDHLDYYKDLKHIQETFQKWVSGVKPGGACVRNRQDKNSMALTCMKDLSFEVLDRQLESTGQSFTVDQKEYHLSIPGEFNAQNAGTAIVTAKYIGVSPEICAEALQDFKGTWRRFEHVGKWQEADIYSDYAHHPDGVKGTIEAFKEAFPNRRLVVVFEPHQKSRTKELFAGFVESFDLADELIIGEIYEVEGRNEGDVVSSEDLVDAIKSRDTVKSVSYGQDYDKIESLLRDSVKADDIVVFMGAGTIDNLARKLV